MALDKALVFLRICFLFLAGFAVLAFLVAEHRLFFSYPFAWLKDRRAGIFQAAVSLLSLALSLGLVACGFWGWASGCSRLALLFCFQ